MAMWTVLASGIAIVVAVGGVLALISGKLSSTESILVVGIMVLSGLLYFLTCVIVEGFNELKSKS